MLIRSLKIQNYKSFADSEEIPLDPGFNLIVGQNDSGKTALLESLQPGMEYKPHRSLLNAPEMLTPPVPHSKSTKRFQLTSQDIETYLSRLEKVGVPSVSGNATSAVSEFRDVVARGCVLSATWHNLNPVAAWTESVSAGAASILQFTNKQWPRGIELGEPAGSGGHSYPFDIVQQLSRDIYAFKAERYNMGACPANGNRVLHPNASNLPEVLNKLADDPATERELLDHAITIFPHITHISSALENGGTAHIRIWTHPTSSKRRDLAIPLADSGNGIGQVLAMLYVAVTADRPKVILIDEPQSFLHPGAIRKLFEILSGYSQHQYVITTHAPTGLNITGATNMLLVRRGQDQSTVVRLDPSAHEGVRMFLADVGARMSDVFGVDSVLWVEGKTEERCFPILVREVAKRQLRGVQILGVVNTGDLEAGFAERVITIYQRLSGGPSIMPPALAFIFDSEGRSDTERQDISRRGRDLVKWLPRRMFENYLIESWAICQILNDEDKSRDAPVNQDELEAWLSAQGSAAKYFPKPSEAAPYLSLDWNEKVHAGKVLKDLFSVFTGERIQYDKVRHGEKLTRLLAANPSDSIRQLAEFIANLCTKP